MQHTQLAWMFALNNSVYQQELLRINMSINQYVNGCRYWMVVHSIKKTSKDNG